MNDHSSSSDLTLGRKSWRVIHPMGVDGSGSVSRHGVAEGSLLPNQKHRIRSTKFWPVIDLTSSVGMSDFRTTGDGHVDAFSATTGG